MDWLHIKNAVEAFTGLERDALHVYGAVAVQLVAVIVSRKPLASFVPWSCVLVVEGANEASDLLTDGLVEAWEVQGAVHDLWNTMLLPSLLLLLTRFAPSLAVGRRPDPSARHQEAERISRSDTAA
ncbi:MAG TPA: hypothetical protein VGB62_00315 [Allosphingosinicella sp.]|jgi:hypothetical protein